MRSEYILSESKKAELADIDRRLEMLYRQIRELEARKAQIYILSPVKYITETPEEVDNVVRIKELYEKLWEPPLDMGVLESIKIGDEVIRKE